MKINLKSNGGIRPDAAMIGTGPAIYEITTSIPDGAVQREREAHRMSVTILSQLMGNLRVPILLSGKLDFFELRVFLKNDMSYSDHHVDTIIQSMTRLLTVEKIQESSVRDVVEDYFNSNPLPTSSVVIANTDDTTGGIVPGDVIDYEELTRKVVAEITKAYERSVTRGFGDALVAANTSMGTPDAEASLASIKVRRDLTSALASVQRVYVSLYNRQAISDVLSSFAADVANNPLLSFMTRMHNISNSSMSALTEVRMANVVNQFIDNEILNKRFRLVLSRFDDTVSSDQSDFMFKISGDPTIDKLTYKAVLSRYLEFFTSIMKGESIVTDGEPLQIDQVIQALTDSVIAGNDYSFAMSWIKSSLSSVKTNVDRATVDALDDVMDLIVLVKTFNSVVGGHPSTRKSVFGEAFNKAYSPMQLEQNKGRVDEVSAICGLVLDAVSDGFSFLHEVVMSTKAFDDVNSDVQNRVRKGLEGLIDIFSSSTNNPVSVVYHPSHFLTTENALGTLSIGGQIPELVEYLPDSAVSSAKSLVVFDSSAHALRKLTVFANNKWDLLQSDQVYLYEIFSLLRGNINPVPTVGHYYRLKVSSPFSLDEALLRAARSIPFDEFIRRDVAGALEGEYEIVTLTSVEAVMNYFKIPYDVISTTNGDYASLFKRFLSPQSMQVFAFPKNAYDNFVFFTNRLKGIEGARYAYEFSSVDGLTLSRYVSKVQQIGYVVTESVAVQQQVATPSRVQHGVLEILLGLSKPKSKTKVMKKSKETDPSDPEVIKKDVLDDEL